VAFPADPLDVTVTIAFDGSTPVDVSAYVRVADGINRTYGRPGKSADSSDPSRVSFTLQTAGAGGEPDLAAGTWNPYDPAGAYWRRDGWLRAPVVITVEGSTWFTGRLSACVPRWDLDGAGYADIEAAGPLRWVIQKRPVRSPLERAIVAEGAALYLPLTDGPIASSAATPMSGLTPIDVDGIKFAQVAGPIGDPRSLPEMARDEVGAVTAWQVNLDSATGTSWCVDVMLRGERVVDAFTDYTACGWAAGSGATESFYTLGFGWDGGSSDPDELTLFGYEINDTGYFALTIDSELVLDGNWHHIRVQSQPSGSSTRVDMTLDGTVAVADSGTTVAPGGVTRVEIFTASTTTLKSGSIGHLAVYDDNEPGETHQAARGYWGEDVATRLARLATQDDVTIDVVTGTYGTATLGPQPTAKLSEILRDVESADLGRLVERLDADALRYVSRDARYGAAVTLTIGAEHQAVSPKPEMKVGGAVGSVTVSRPGGSSAIATDAAAVAAGGVDATAEPNVATDGVLLAIGQWILSSQPVGATGVSTVQLDLGEDGGSLVADWLAAIVAQPIRAAIAGVAGLPAGLDVFVEGWTEMLTDVDWTIGVVMSPARPYDVFVRGDDQLGRRDATASTLDGAVLSSATALSVATSSGPVWTTESAHLPLDIDVEGEQITVTGIAGSTSPQTFTVTRATNGVVKALPDGSDVKLWRPGVRAL